jgi:hypothetical protein
LPTLEESVALVLQIQAAVSGVSVANPAGKVSVGSNYGLQGFGPVPYANAPVTINSGDGSSNSFIHNATALLDSLKNPSPTAPSGPAIVRPPTLNYAAIQAKARADAENAVNPFYTKQLNDFLSQQAAQRTQQQTVFDTSVKNLDEQLKQAQDANKLTGERTTADVAQNQADINQTADQFQTDTGQAADANRLAEADKLAGAGLTGGIGAQQGEATQTQRNTTEKRQEADFQKSRDQQELFKGRTFEDLAKSGELAAKSTAKGKTAAKFDLDSFIQNQGFETTSKKSSLEQARLQAVATEQQNQAKLAYNQYLARIRDPAQLAAAGTIYGGSF